MIPLVAAAVFGAVTLATGGAVVWGRVRRVRAVQPAAWAHRPVILAEQGVHLADLERALGLWRDLGYDLPAAQVVTTVGLRAPGTITVRVDRGLATPSTVYHDGQPDALNAGPREWGRTHVVADDAIRDRHGRRALVSADVAVHPDATWLAIAHEIGHALGHLHPVAPPTGVLMYPGAIGLGDDLRGLECTPWVVR